MTLKDLLIAIKSTKIININLFDSNELLLISFGLPGYDALDDELLERKVDSIEILSLVNISIILAESNTPSETEG